MLIDIKVPVLAESVSEATLMDWQKSTGDVVSRGDSLIDIETDKVTLEIAAPNNGVLVEILKGDGEDVSSDEVIARLETEATAGAGTEPAKPKESNVPQQQSLEVGEIPAEPPKLSPAVRNLLDEHNLDAANIPASGDRLTKEDILNYLGNTKSSPPELNVVKSKPVEEKIAALAPEPVAAPVTIPVPESTSGPVVSGERPEERVPMTRLRRRTAERLLSAQHENAILTTFNEINMKPVMDLRASHKDEFEKVHGVKLGFMSFFTKAVVDTLKKFPAVNASIDGTDIIYHGYFDIGIAVSSQKGLVVPILRDADLISFAETESKIREYGEKAKDSKLTIEELTGGTFTITNGGIFGSMLSTPILNPPQSAILGMHNIQDRAVVENGEIVIRPMMYVALSYDHRIIDGRDAVQFLVMMKKQLEDPARLLLQI